MITDSRSTATSAWDAHASTRQAPLIELFSAIQGEGLNVGTRQLFIRFAFCDLRCQFCDSAHTWTAPERCAIERSPGVRDFERHDNPVSVETLLGWVERQHHPNLHDSISITGGEPLLHAAFLKEFLPQVRQRTGLPIYLETGGHRPHQLVMLLPYLDSVGMDIKLPSVSGETLWQAHEAFLRRCWEAQTEVFIKLIVSRTTVVSELTQAADLVAGVSADIPVFLQPVTPLTLPEQHSKSDSAQLQAPTPDQVLTWQALMKRSLNQVRVIPQTHKFIGQR